MKETVAKVKICPKLMINATNFRINMKKIMTIFCPNEMLIYKPLNIIFPSITAILSQSHIFCLGYANQPLAMMNAKLNSQKYYY